MKKHLLRLFTVLLMVCLGVGVLTACGGDETDDNTGKDDDDQGNETPVTQPIEGVWSGATAAVSFGSDPVNCAFTATLDVEGEKANVVFAVAPIAEGTAGEVMFRIYIGLDKQTDGSYKCEMQQGSRTGSYVAKLNADDKLEIVCTNIFGEDDSVVTLTFTSSTELPEAISLSGTWYALEGTEYAGIRFDFATKKLTIDETEYDMTVVSMAGYVAVSYSVDDDYSMPIVIGKSGNDYYAYTMEGDAYKLTQTDPTPSGPQPSDDPTFEGVWTGASVADVTYTAYVKVVDEKAHAVIVAAYGGNKDIHVKTLDHQQDGSYKLETTEGTFSGQLDGSTLNASFPKKLFSSSAADDETLEITFTEWESLPAGLGLSGTWYEFDSYTEDYTGISFNFDDNEIKLSKDGDPIAATYTEIGPYTIVEYTVSNGFSGGTLYQGVITEEEGTYCYYTCENGKLASLSGNTLTQTAPQEPEEGVYTIVYAGTGVSGITDDGEYHVGDTVNITTQVPGNRWAYTFAGWENSGNLDDNAVYGHGAGQQQTYVVKAEDEYSDGVIRFNAKWERIPAEDRTYTVTFEDTSQEQVQVPTDITNLAYNATVTIPEMPGTRVGHNFRGWMLNYNSEQLYIHGDPTYGTYNVSDDDVDDEEVGTITFYAVWDDTFQDESVDITGVWTSGTKSVTVVVVEGYGGAVVKDGNQYAYYDLTAAANGYNGTDGATFVPNAAGTELVVTIGVQVTTYTQKTNLGTIELEGKKFTGTSAEMGAVSIDFEFEEEKITLGSEVVDQTFTYNTIGGYGVITVNGNNVIIYQDGGTYYLAGLGSTSVELTEDVPTPSLDINGVWTYEGTTITIKLEDGEGSGHMIMVMDGTYTYYALTKTQEGYSFTDNYDVSGTLTISGNSIIVTISENPVTLTEKTALDAEITITGKYTFDASSMGSGTGTIDFDTNMANFTGEEGAFTSVKVGKYIVVQFMGQNIVFYEKDSGSYYFYFNGSMGQEIALTPYTAPAKTEYTVEFWMEKKDTYPATTDPGHVGTKSFELADDEAITGESVYKPDDPTKDNYDFAGWWIDEETQYTEGFVPSEHAAGGTTLNVYAKWTLKETIQVEEEITAVNWATKVYQYPENITVGDKLTFTGDVTLTRAEKAEIYDGVYIALSKTNFTDHVAVRYDWDTVAESGKYTEFADGYLSCSIAGEWNLVGLPQIMNGTDVKMKAEVAYPISTQVQVIYTITATVSGKTETYTVTHVYYGINGEPVSVGFAGEEAKLNNTQIVRSKITAPVIEDTTAKGSVTIGTSKTSGYGTDAYTTNIKPGQTLTITGNLQTDADSNFGGFGMEMIPYGVSNLIADNGPFNFRIDNYCNNTDVVSDGLRQAACTRYNYKIAKEYTHSGDPEETEEWAAFVAAKKDIDVTITVAWTKADEIVITMAFSNSKTAEYTAYTRTQTYTVTPLAEGSHLANAYTFTFSPDAGYIAGAQAEVTYSAIG